MTSSARVLRSLVALLAAGGAVLFAGEQRRGGQAPPPPPPQQPVPQLPPVFRSGVNLVPVDVRVVDSRGQPVTDLKENEFYIAENSVRQQIRHFSTTALKAERDVKPQPLLRTDETPTIGAQNRRVFLIVLGRGRLQHPGKGVDGALELIKKHLLPQDYVGIMAWNRATDLTTDHAKVLGVMDRFKKDHEKVEALLRQQFSGLAAIYGGREIPAPVQKEIDAIFSGPDAPGTRQVPPAAMTDAARMAGDTRRTTDAMQTQAQNAAGTTAPRLNSIADDTTVASMDLSLDEFVEVNSQSMQDLATLYTGISYLRHVNGEKHLLFVSAEGMLLPRAEDDRGIAAAASDARVALSILHTGGTRPQGGIDWRIPISSRIANLTGGTFTSLQTGPDFVERVDRESRFQYTLGYYPTNSVMDSKYRRIDVRVLRPGGYRVLYRHGYFARQFQAGFDRQRMIIYSRVTAAASYSMEVSDLPIAIQDAKLEKKPDGTSEIAVQVHISPDRLSLTEADGRRKGSLDIAVFCADGNERMVGISWDTFQFEMTPDAHQRFLQKGITFTGRVAVSAPARHIKVVVYDAGADLVGSAMLRVK
jgi:VWFA-related protein